jgi:hypothetical protein
MTCNHDKKLMFEFIIHFYIYPRVIGGKHANCEIYNFILHETLFKSNKVGSNYVGPCWQKHLR